MRTPPPRLIETFEADPPDFFQNPAATPLPPLPVSPPRPPEPPKT